MTANELKGVVDTQVERVNNLVKALDDLVSQHRSAAREVKDFQTRIEKDIALLQHDMTELKKGRETLGNRAFDILKLLLAAGLGAAGALLVKKYVSG